jgi:hypothetical protein
MMSKSPGAHSPLVRHYPRTPSAPTRELAAPKLQQKTVLPSVSVKEGDPSPFCWISISAPRLSALTDPKMTSISSRLRPFVSGINLCDGRSFKNIKGVRTSSH